MILNAQFSPNDPLAQRLDVIKGVGPKKLQAFADAEVHTVRDLLSILPKGFEERRCSSISQAPYGQVAIILVQVVAVRFIGFGRKKHLQVAVRDETSQMRLLFFNPGKVRVRGVFEPGRQIVVVGKVDLFGNTRQMVHPKVFAPEKMGSLEGIWPIYPAINDLSASEIHKIIHQALDTLRTQSLEDLFEQAWLAQHKMLPLKEAFDALHHNHEQAPRALRRLAFEELFSLQLSVQKRAELNAAQAGIAIQASLDDDALFTKLTQMCPTGAQQRVLAEIFRDLERAVPMMRLLQGDVGAGKTAVAAAACLKVVQAGLQCAVLAPTEILVEQHVRAFKDWFAPLGIQVVSLTASQKAAQKRQSLCMLADHSAQIVVGTHALLGEAVAFDSLGLCVIDEQHRFGVMQRKALLDKGRLKPHLLSMTATPIPRSLALTVYGDMSLSLLDELPPGRQPVQTKILTGDPIDSAIQLLQRARDQNRQAFVVFPLVEASEKVDLQDATRAFTQFGTIFGQEHVALVHGQMKAEQKDAAMGRFVRNEAQILISTTVIEVGVNVPNATLMLIMHPERFGLSQLHQLRGRVARGNAQSYCFLLPEQDAFEAAQERLQILANNTCGFAIADADLALRGPGDLLGTKQAGTALFDFFDMGPHQDLIEPARQAALVALSQDGQLESPTLASYLQRARVFFSA